MNISIKKYYKEKQLMQDMAYKSNLYLRAVRNIETERKEELEESVKEEYKRLLYESQKKIATRKIKDKISCLYKKSLEMRSSGWACLALNGLKRSIARIHETGIYHPADLRDLEKRIERGY